MEYSYILKQVSEFEYVTTTDELYVSDSLETLKNHVESIKAEFILEEDDTWLYQCTINRNVWYVIRKVKRL